VTSDSRRVERSGVAAVVIILTVVELRCRRIQRANILIKLPELPNQIRQSVNWGALVDLGRHLTTQNYQRLTF
jgi:hypothetical protein